MFWIRADGNADIGAGHLMRCLTIAEELSVLRGGREDIRFLCADARSAELARGHGFRSHVLGTDYRRMEDELPLLEGLWGKPPGEPEGRAVLVDSYDVTDRYLETLKQWGYVILMDDSGRHPYPVNCVVNYNAPASPEAYRELYGGQDVRLLIGNGYVPLRRQFGNARYTPGKVVRKVLITTGGGDGENIAGAVLDAVYRPDLEFFLVIGQFNPHFDRMQKLAQERGNLHIRHNVSDMAGLMCVCDMALTAGGSTVYELASLGVPMICFSYAENQEALVEYMGKKGVAPSAGAWHKDPDGTLGRIRELFSVLEGDESLRLDYHRKEKALVDGRGAVSLAQMLSSLAAQGGERGR